MRRRCNRLATVTSNREISRRAKEVRGKLNKITSETTRQLKLSDASRLQREQALMKWDPCSQQELVDHLQSQSQDADSNQNNNNQASLSEGKKDDCKEMIHALIGVALGNFNRVCVRHDHNGCHVTCACEMFRRDATCMESKLFGLLLGNVFPPANCVDKEQSSPWKMIANDLRKAFQKCHICSEQMSMVYNVNPPPLIDPMIAVPKDSNTHERVIITIILQRKIH